MKTIIPIYIDKESMLWIAENRIHSRNFISIFKNRAQLFLDMTEEEIDDMDEWVIKIYTPENAKKNIIEKINSTAVDLYMESKCENKL